MRAWSVEGRGEPGKVLVLRDVPTPKPDAGFIRIRIAAAAIGFPDVLMCRGTYPLTPPGSFTPGQEVVGTVTAVGDGVDPGLIGSRQMGVTAFYLGSGGFADEALAAETTVNAAPDWLEDADAAGFHIPFYTGWIGLRQRAQLAAGETLVVLGAAGGTGAAAVRIGRALDARVIAVVGGGAKARYCGELGADVVIDHETDDVAQTIMNATAGRGPDVVYDPVGGRAAETIARTVAPHGRFLFVGFASGSWPVIDPGLMVQRNFSSIGVFAGAYDRDHAERAYDSMLPMLQNGSLASVVTHRVPFEELPAAMTRLGNRSAIGRWVLLP